MSSVTYAFGVDSVVYHVAPSTAAKPAVVLESVVKTVQIMVNHNTTTIEYGIVYTQRPGTTHYVTESTLFPDIDAALLYYKNIVITA